MLREDCGYKFSLHAAVVILVEARYPWRIPHLTYPTGQKVAKLTATVVTTAVCAQSRLHMQVAYLSLTCGVVILDFTDDGAGNNLDI